MLDGGAYTSFGVITVYHAGPMTPTLYRIPSYKYLGKKVYGNKSPWGAMRVLGACCGPCW